MALLVEYLTSMREALGSSLNTAYTNDRDPVKKEKGTHRRPVSFCRLPEDP